jgi:hypothetical protein
MRVNPTTSCLLDRQLFKLQDQPSFLCVSPADIYSKVVPRSTPGVQQERLTQLLLHPRRANKAYLIVLTMLLKPKIFQPKILILIIGLAAILLMQLWLEYFFPRIILDFHSNGFFLKLNQWAGLANGERSADYYIGTIVQRWLGPFINTLSYAIFSVTIIGFWGKANNRIFWVLSFCFLLVSKWPVLTYPFYGDAIGGPFAEALWLADHQFNYAALFQQPGYSQGGARVYGLSLYPTFLALLLKLIPSTKVFLIVNHLIVFAMTAGIAVMLRSLAQKAFKNSSMANLTAILFLAIPIVQSQSEAINMEMPSVFFSVLSVYFLANKQLLPATLYALLATFIKGHALIAGVLVLFISGVLFFFDEKWKGRWLSLALGLLAISGAFVKVGSKFFLKDQHASAGMIQLFAGWPSLKGMTIFYLYLVLLIGLLILAMKSLLLVKKPWPEIRKSIFQVYYIDILMVLMAGLWFLLFLNFFAVSPRYRLLAAPFLVFTLAVFISRWLKNQKIACAVIGGAVLLATVTSYGLWHQPVLTHDHVILERSLEYRNDLKLNKKLVKIIQQQYPKFTIGAPFLTAQMLAIPELGYVNEPLDVVVYGMPVQYRGIKNFQGLGKLDIITTLWIGLPMQDFKKGPFVYPIHPKDRVIEHLEFGNNYANLFFGGIAIEQRWQIIQKMKNG